MLFNIKSLLKSDKSIFKIFIAFLLLLILFSAPSAFAQKRNHRFFTKNLTDYDDKRLHYGICLVGTSNKFVRKYSDYFNANSDSTFAVNPKSDLAAGVGLLINYKIADHWDIRFSPVVNFYQRSIEYRFTSGSKATQTIESSFLEFPLLLKYRSMRRGNVGMYMLAGVKPGIEIGSKKGENRIDLVKTDNIDFSIEYGFGFDLYYTYFKFSPEIRFSHGIKNMIVSDNTVFAKSLSKLTTHNVSLYLYFE